MTSPCDAPTGTGYRRLDNQLYRVEIRDPAATRHGTATFLWSRENGSVTARLLKKNGNDLVLDSIGRDGRLSFDQGWVEVTNSELVLHGKPGFLGSIGHVQGTTVTVADWYGGRAAGRLRHQRDRPAVGIRPVDGDPARHRGRLDRAGERCPDPVRLRPAVSAPAITG